VRINIVIGGVDRDRGTAGHAMLFGYANGLLDRGHEVAIVTTVPSYEPRWFELRVPIVQPPRTSALAAALRAALRFGGFRVGVVDKRSAKDALSALTAQLAPWSALPYRRASGIERLRLALPAADVTLATGAPTALPVWLLGTGAKAYFMQGYETWFQVEHDRRWQHVYELECELSYKLPLRRIANCTWLAETVRERHGGEAEVCVNALDHELYFPDGRREDGPFTVASYSGRGAALKGFRDAAHAMRLVRERLGDVRWRVFGEDAELPPDNDLAPYESIGVVDAPALRRLFSEADLALCPAWHDAFPMYPMEAMACGCAVVTTGIGVEDYAAHERNALVVPVREPRAMADAVVRLHDDRALRARLVDRALLDVKRFTWTRSLERMEELLERFAGEAAADAPSPTLATGGPS
jgi:glycosyltransferase involved in cell wall biosynthesis